MVLLPNMRKLFKMSAGSFTWKKKTVSMKEIANEMKINDTSLFNLVLIKIMRIKG